MKRWQDAGNVAGGLFLLIVPERAGASLIASAQAGRSRRRQTMKAMLSLLWICALALPLAWLAARGWRAFDGSVRALDGFVLLWLPRSLVVMLVLSALYLTWR